MARPVVLTRVEQSLFETRLRPGRVLGIQGAPAIPYAAESSISVSRASCDLVTPACQISSGDSCRTRPADHRDRGRNGCQAFAPSRSRRAPAHRLIPPGAPIRRPVANDHAPDRPLDQDPEIEKPNAPRAIFFQKLDLRPSTRSSGFTPTSPIPPCPGAVGTEGRVMPVESCPVTAGADLVVVEDGGAEGDSPFTARPDAAAARRGGPP